MLEYIINHLIPNLIFWFFLVAFVAGALVIFAQTWKLTLTLVVLTVVGAICGAAILGDGLLPLNSMTPGDFVGASLGTLVGFFVGLVVVVQSPSDDS